MNNRNESKKAMLEQAILFFKSWSAPILALVILAGILAIFVAGLINGHSPSIDILNQFVSIILGVVATIMSIVSLLMSCYGLEKTEESELRQRSILQQILDEQRDTRRSIDVLEQNRQIVSIEAQTVEEEATDDVDLSDLL